MTDSNLQKAIRNLRIADLYVRDLTCKCSGDFDPKYFDMEAVFFQTKYVVTRSEVLQGDVKEQIFRVFVEVGAKWSQDAQQGDKSVIDLAWIEAEYIAEYIISDELEKDCLDEFALKNVSYHVWPYWRELLASQCERMRLPRTLLPMTQVAHNHDADVEK